MIGIFDSGVGGLTVAAAIRKRAPSVDMVYFGDIANAPYGIKNRATLEQLTFQAFRLLRSLGATQLVSACNSVSASVILPMLELFGVYDSGIVEMVGPAARALKERLNGRMIVIATPATVDSAMYQKGFREVGLDVRMIACPELAGAIEFGESLAVIERYVDAVVAQAFSVGCDTLVLGCTHYPLVRDVFERCIAARGSLTGRASAGPGGGIALYDPADAVALVALTRHGVLGNGISRFVISQDSQVFRRYVEQMFDNAPISIEVATAATTFSC